MHCPNHECGCGIMLASHVCDVHRSTACFATPEGHWKNSDLGVIHKQNLFIGAIANMLDVSSSFQPFLEAFWFCSWPCHKLRCTTSVCHLSCVAAKVLKVVTPENCSTYNCPAVEALQRDSFMMFYGTEWSGLCKTMQHQKGNHWFCSCCIVQAMLATVEAFAQLRRYNSHLAMK